MRHYELVVVLSPMLNQEQSSDAWGRIKDFISNRSADITHEEKWGTRRLAYPIRKGSYQFLEGSYHLTRFSTESPFNRELALFLRLDDQVLRSLVVVAQPPGAEPAPAVVRAPAAVAEPVAEAPGAVEEPVAEAPAAVEEPVAEEPAAVEEPVAEEPAAVEEPVAEAPAAVEEPVAEAPGAVEEPVAEAPGAVEEPVAEALGAVEEPVAEALGAVEEPVAEAADEERPEGAEGTGGPEENRA